MSKDNFLKNLGALGFPLVEAREEPDANAVLADMAESRELRLWEGFPVVLANAGQRGLFDLAKAKKCLKGRLYTERFYSLVAMSLAVYEFFKLRFPWAQGLSQNLPQSARKQVSDFYQALKTGSELGVAGRRMSPERLQEVFRAYFTQAQERVDRLLVAREELGLEYSLSQVFSPKQKELFLKKLANEKLSKTEKEYFSRVVKKKVRALANPELFRMAQKLIG